MSFRALLDPVNNKPKDIWRLINDYHRFESMARACIVIASLCMYIFWKRNIPFEAKVCVLS